MNYVKNTPEHARKNLIELCNKYTDVFALPEDNLTVNNFYEQKLRLTSDNPVYVKKLQTTQNAKR